MIRIVTGKVQVKVSATSGENYHFKSHDKVRHAVKIVKQPKYYLKW